VRPLALVGNLSRDRVDGGPPRIGGAPFYGAAALRLLGRRAHVLAKCADGDRRSFLRALAPVGVPVTLVRAASTTSFSFRYDGDVRTMHVDDIGDPWRPADVASLPAAAWVHVAPLLRDDFPTETLAAIARGRRVLFDGQGLVRRRGVGPLRLDAEFDDALLAHVSVLKLGEEEARVLEPVPELAVGEVVVTLGSRGAVVYAHGAETRVAAHPIAGVDPTGAGDAFATAYALSRAEGLRPAAAARRATAVVAAMLSHRPR
jgi:sugar/nucleoside kinase (ribokinase family)